MKIHVFDTDVRKITEPEIYKTNMGSFGIVADIFNQGLKVIGHYAEPDEADYVGICDGLNFSFKYKNKNPFLIHVWDQINTLPLEILQMQQYYKIKMVGLSSQVSRLWNKYGVHCRTAMPACDTSFYQPLGRKENESFTFLFESFANVRSGLDLAVESFWRAFGSSKEVKLIIKNTSKSKILASKIQSYIDRGANIELITDRISFDKMRDLYLMADCTLHVYRHSSWGLGIHQAASCGSIILTGDFCPSNEMKVIGESIKPSSEVLIKEKLPELVGEWGLHNAYGDFHYGEDPRFYDYNLDEYSEKLKYIVKNKNILGGLALFNHNEISYNFDIRLCASNLVKALS